MTTASFIESMTDRGQFENLATAVLRAADPTYRYVIQTGINSEGETVRSPVDGFCEVPHSNPRHFVFVGHTTTARRYLDTKWLEDIDKALTQASLIQVNVPHATFTAVLTANCTPGLDLLRTTYTNPKLPSNFSWDIWDVLRIASFLDNDSEGQWLRQSYFGIRAERMSPSLATEIANTSAMQYSETLTVGQFESTVRREIDDSIYETILGAMASCFLLAGDSGAGKTTVAVRLLQRWLADGRLGLHIPGEVVDRSATLDEAVSTAIARLHAGLEASARHLYSYAAAKGAYLIIVDDVNRTSRAEANIRKVIAWSRQLSRSPATNSSDAVTAATGPCLLACPVWLTSLGALSIETRSANWIRVETVPLLSRSESEAAVSRLHEIACQPISDEASSEIAERLGRDPFLIGAYGNLLYSDQPISGETNACDLVEQFIDQKLASIVASSILGEQVSDYKRSAEEIALSMLKHRNLRPKWQDVRSWKELPGFVTDRFGRVLSGREIGGLEADDTISFRHDRIAGHLYSRVLRKLAIDSNGTDGLLSEPYYAEIIGEAIVGGELSATTLGELEDRNPLAIAEAFRIAARTRTSDLEPLGIRLTAILRNPEVIPEIRWAVESVLMDTSTPRILDVLAGLPEGGFRALAMMRNGSAEHGAWYCRTHSFLPGYTNTELTRALAPAVRNHSDRIIHDISKALSNASLSDDERNGWLDLAGMIGDKQLLDGVLSAWESSSKDMHSLRSAVWASFRCGWAEPERIVPIVEHWNNMPEPEDKSGLDPKHWISTPLGHAFRHGLRDEIIDFLEVKRDDYPTISWRLVTTLDDVNSAKAVLLVVAEGARTIKDARKSGSHAMWIRDVTRNWKERTGSQGRLSDEARAAVLKKWKDERCDVDERFIAFELWASGAKIAEIELLQSIPKEHPLFRDAVIVRAELGDLTAVPHFCEFATQQSYLFWYADGIWTPEIADVLDRWLAKEANDLPRDLSGYGRDDLSRILLRIPPSDAGRLLEKNWMGLQHAFIYVQTAVLVGTPLAHSLVNRALDTWRDAPAVWQYLRFTLEDALGRSGVDAQHVLRSLEPYLDRIPLEEIDQFGSTLRIFRSVLWGRQHLVGRVSDHMQAHYFPDAQQVEAALDNLLSDKFGPYRVEGLLEDWGGPEGLLDWIYDISADWVRLRRNARAVMVFEQIALATGSRKCLAILNEIELESTEEELRLAIQAAKFQVSRNSLS